MNCPRCGIGNPPASRFCGSCGAPLASAPVPSAPPPMAAPVPQYAPPPPPPPPQYAAQQVNVQVGGYPGAMAPAGPAKSGCVAALLGWFIPGAGQMYAGQVGCGILALIGCFILYGTAGALIMIANNMAPSEEEAAAVMALIGMVASGFGFLVWLISFIMGIVAAGKRR